jgi:pyridoxal phosphate enzyme (YggS family)
MTVNIGGHGKTPLAHVRGRIADACRSVGRNPADVTLLAVSKTRSLAEVLELHAQGQYRFGENYPQELMTKADGSLEMQLMPAIEWHFIGALQANKTRVIAERAAWVHSIDRFRIASRLASQRPAHLPPLQVCIQVDLSHEPGKSGVAEDEVETLAAQITELPGIQLRGLMTIPAPCSDPVRQREPFARLRQILARLVAAGYSLDTLSMGMSDDLEAAIAEGATLVRIGTALFGPRKKQVQQETLCS